MQMGGEGTREEPILLLGATGFSPAQRETIQTLLGRLPEGGPGWSLVPFSESDAWWVNGSRIQLLADGNLRVKAGQPTEHALHLDLAEIHRPVAFSTPLAATGFEPRCVFDLDDAASVFTVLQDFHEWLRVLRAQFALGAMVVQRGVSLRGTIHHLVHQGHLLAVLDYRNGHAAIHPGAEVGDLWQAEWDKRPPGAANVPPRFVDCTPTQLVWAYVRRTRNDLLPPRYRTDTIYFRHAPRVPLRWLRDSLLSVVRELNSAPGTFAELRQRTGISEPALARDLACMYFAGAITTTPEKAAPPAGGRDGDASTPSEASASLPKPQDVTVPALLDLKLLRPGNGS
jgi:hypothetical protein